ncbi:MAG TPA: tRNA epoxyqueuosine(34) reductase QueG [Pyrinomonadaceae bacterium]|nr:tRNA epoxyqueuosine(34) reductase QueG [Acidobacteriota bacterium]HQZ95518.1 tRNA epoxyqueuosine(34) reductase QueG [Pyrinomonadaceae bacterium]
MSSLSQNIKQKAALIGFSGVGIVRADALDDEAKHFREWLANGYHGTMAWLEREPEKRSDPRILFPGARSVIVLMLNYYTDHEHADDPERGKISRYAWGDDYHDVMREKLNELLVWIKTEVPEAEGKVCVDTAPMMDKAWAVRAGLGWLGKHSNLITTEVGSWVFIGEIILNVELEYDSEVVADHCGSCSACLDACPTNAIVEPYVVDARKCISYATIELRDENLPAEISENLEGWFYGCDICQDVCPWNRFEKATEETRFEPRKGESSLNIDGIISMTNDEYIERFRRSAIKRAKIGGLKRNASALK